MDAANQQRAVVVDASIRLLERREHSRLELERKLARRGHPPEVVEDVIGKLVEAGLQSDERFAQAFVDSALRRGQGPLKIRAGLRERGVDDDIATVQLDCDAEAWRVRAADALRKRFGGVLPADHGEWARRARFLAARGFPSDVTATAIGSFDGP